MDTMTLIISIAAIVAVAVVLSRVITWLFKIILLVGIIWFLMTQVDFPNVEHQIQKWTKRQEKTLRPWTDSLRRGNKDGSVGL
jgi:ABC-type bacteriocin/lantibiotic exporter with double-glycine peptidase domain